ncbi:MAG: type II toxin-antitoxin system HicA family toxin [bacterium]
MDKLPIVSGRELVEFFKQHGFAQRSRKRGSHITLTKSGALRPLVIPDRKNLKPGIIKSNLRTAGISRATFIAAIRKRKK